MRKIIFILFFILTMFYFPNVNADVISVNSGGNEGILINPDNYVEGFFSCVPTTCTKLGYNCDTWNDKCGKTINCGACGAEFTCTSGICTAVPPSPPGGGGGAGGGGAGGEIIPGIFVTPTSINLTLSFNNQTHMSQRITQIIYITNKGESSKTLPISQIGLNSLAIFENTPIILAPGETKELKVDFVAPLEERDFSGSILVDGKTIPVFLHVTSNPLWFDSNIVVLNKDYQVAKGSTLKTSVGLIPQGEKSRLDVTLNYVIKDVSGKIYLTKSETVLVENKMDFERDFGTGMLPIGNYIITLDLIYPGGIAPSSAHFEVVPMSISGIFGVILFFLIMIILVILIIIVIILIKKKRRESKSNVNV